MADAVLALNSGSSSIKAALFRGGAAGALLPVWRGEVEGLGLEASFQARDPGGALLAERRWPGGQADYESILGWLLEWIESHHSGDTLAAVGHRVVHGGRSFADPVRLSEAVIAQLEALSPLAPLHQPHCLSPAKVLWALRPGLAQVACFDTAFHRTLSAVATRYALPRSYEAQGVRRYGFHGLSYEYVSSRLREIAPELAAGRVVVAHLGSGASLCAMQAGRSVDTSMGFSALDGLAMGTRCGSLDPGVVLYMLRECGLRPDQVEHILYYESGLLGVSGLSSDMRTLLASPAAAAQEAVELFVFRVVREAAALTGTLGGLDGIVFTAGIGERAAPVRAAICARLRWLGVELDPAANARQDARLHAQGSRAQVWMIPTDEELMIARHTAALRGP